MKLCDLLIVGGAVYLIWDYAKKREAREQAAQNAVTGQTVLPSGAKPTGRTQETTGTAPGEEFIGHAKRIWAEIIMPDGERTWVEAKSSPLESQA